MDGAFDAWRNIIGNRKTKRPWQDLTADELRNIARQSEAKQPVAAG